MKSVWSRKLPTGSNWPVNLVVSRWHGQLSRSSVFFFFYDLKSQQYYLLARNWSAIWTLLINVNHAYTYVRQLSIIPFIYICMVTNKLNYHFNQWQLIMRGKVYNTWFEFQVTIVHSLLIKRLPTICSEQVANYYNT
jgi:hypothetical protein